MLRFSHRNIVLSAVVVVVAQLTAGSALGSIDNLKTLVSREVGAGGTSNSLGSYGYTETTDANDQVIRKFYVATFGGGSALRSVVEGETTSTTLLNEEQLQLFYRDGDTSRTVTTPTISGILTNPAAVGSFASNQGLWISDIALTRLPGGSGVVDPAASKRLYSLDTANPVSSAGLNTVVTIADFQSAASNTSTTVNFGRQVAFSPNGQTIYAVEIQTNYGGVWKIDPITGNPTRLLNVTASGSDAVRLANEPAVQRIGNVDRIYINGNHGESVDTNFNIGGLNYIDHDGTTTSAQQVLIEADDLKSFLQTSAVPKISAIAAGADGSLYMWEGDATSRLIARDPQGRLYKVTTRNERDLFFTGQLGVAPAPSNSVLRLQTRIVQHPTAGEITQLMYAESTPLNFVAGIDIFKPTDFDRDGEEDAADMALFGDVLTVVNAPAALTDARFDLNGNGSIDYHDVLIAQSFQLFPDGDANFDGVVDFDDLLTLAQHYGQQSGQTWVTGDFNGTDSVTFDDLLTLAQNYNGGSSVAGLDASFAADWALAQSMVPEPTGLAGLALAGLFVRRRRRQG